MASYTVSSTKSYMQAMQPMIEALNRINTGNKQQKVPNIDTENAKITPIDKILDKFANVTIDSLKHIGNKSSGCRCCDT